MKNKDLLWVRPDLTFGAGEPSPLARPAKHKSPKSEPFVDDGRETFTVAEVASLWNLSRDTIQRLFEGEPGVITLGNKNSRGKRKRVTLRIPRSVMQRVKKRRSNPA